jgi:hypothetical protein
MKSSINLREQVSVSDILLSMTPPIKLAKSQADLEYQEEETQKKLDKIFASESNVKKNVIR